MYLLNLYIAVNIQDSVFFASCIERRYIGFDRSTTANIFFVLLEHLILFCSVLYYLLLHYFQVGC